jgi:hypothetical protein
MIKNIDKRLSLSVIKYAFFDGDNIGNTIENLLNNGRVQEAVHLSESIKIAIFKIELFIGETEDAEIIIAGGDDVLIQYDSEKYSDTFLGEISQIFTNYTGLSMSCGVGENVSQAINNLTNVKQNTKGAIKSTSNKSGIQVRPMKQTKLYIFTTSDIPDPYVNVIGHCVANYTDIDQVILIGITEDRGKVNLEEDKINKLKNNIANQLNSLSNGKYLKKKGKDWEEIDIDIEPVQCETYGRLKNLFFNIKVLIYQDLEKEILGLLNTGNSVEHLFDVTAVLKSYLVDIYTILRFQNISTIYSFELFNERFYNQKDLIHNLTYKKTYDFPCLAETSYTRDRIVVNEASIISESDFNRLQSDVKMLESNRDRLENTVATEFARFCSFVYFLIWFPVFVWICWSVAQPEGWERVEPLSFVITLGWFLLNYLLQSLFTGKFPSLDPRELFQASKTWRKKNLEKSRLNSYRN